jgi:hypothetical protein
MMGLRTWYGGVWKKKNAERTLRDKKRSTRVMMTMIFNLRPAVPVRLVTCDLPKGIGKC